ncbi:MAG: MBL fold metallo-hydrolase [Actinobacteria bacterium]|nr:MBL fold metallo-hydrolase [Actinomycetota bacterium]
MEHTVEKTFEIFEVGGALGGEAYLIVTSGKTALIDSGFSFSAPKMIENIKGILGDRDLDYVLLTHSHYDHASGSTYCKGAWPKVKIVASAYAAKVLAKDSARKTMRELNDSAASMAGVKSYVDRLDALNVDSVVQEGDVIDLGPVAFEVIEAPGHTRCCIAFWCEKEQFLISCETMGVYAGGHLVMPAYLVAYQDSVDFILRAKALKPRKLLVPHYDVLEGERCEAFIDDALVNAEKLKNDICLGHAKGKSDDELIANFKREFYNNVAKRVQPEAAFDLNASYAIPMVIRECCTEV